MARKTIKKGGRGRRFAKPGREGKRKRIARGHPKVVWNFHNPSTEARGKSKCEVALFRKKNSIFPIQVYFIF